MIDIPNVSALFQIADAHRKVREVVSIYLYISIYIYIYISIYIYIYIYRYIYIYPLIKRTYIDALQRNHSVCSLHVN